MAAKTPKRSSVVARFLARNYPTQLRAKVDAEIRALLELYLIAFRIPMETAIFFDSPAGEGNASSRTIAEIMMSCPEREQLVSTRERTDIPPVKAPERAGPGEAEG